MKIIKLLIVVVVCTLFFSNVCFVYGHGKGTDIANDVWDKIKAVSALKEPDTKFMVDEFTYSSIIDIYADIPMNNYWFHLAKTCQDIFCIGLAEADKHGQIETFAKTYVSKFGSGDTMTDMRWAIACPILATLSDKILYKPEKEILSEKFKIFAMYYNKAIIDNSLTSDTFYKRIVWFTLWAGNKPFKWSNKMFFSSKDDLLGDLEDHFMNIEKDVWVENSYEYWHAMRYFLVIIYLCDWENTLKMYKVSSTNLNKENYNKISRHFVRQNALLLVPRPLYNPTKLKYEIDISKLTNHLPPFELPIRPLPEYIFKWEALRNKNIKTFPRVSKIYFNDSMGWTLEFLHKVSAKKLENIDDDN
jgi:hypothetical protein